MAGIMLDSTNPDAVMAAIKERREWRNMVIRAAALYVDGSGAAPAAVFTALRSRVAVVEITVFGTIGAGAATVKPAGDVEPGDLNPAEGAQWALAESKNGAWPVIYCNRAEKAEVIAECASQGMTLGTSYGLWVATLDGTFTDLNGSDLRDETGVVAVQSLTAEMLGIDADGSVLTEAGDKWLGITPSWQARALQMATDLRTLIRDNQ
jgi:hypothetical protein